MQRALIPILAAILALASAGCHNNNGSTAGSTDTIQTGSTIGDDSAATNSSGGGNGVIATEVPATGSTGTVGTTGTTGTTSSAGSTAGDGGKRPIRRSATSRSGSRTTT